MEPSRTYHADQAAHLSDLINLKFASQKYGTTNPRVVRVKEPDGPSTDGGRQARQPIMLVQKDDEELGAIVCGFIDSTRKMAELRSYAVIGQAHQARYQEDIDISKGEYERLLDQMQEFLSVQAYETRISTVPRRPSTIGPKPQPLPHQAPQATPSVLPLVLAFFTGFAVCYLLVHFGVLR